MHNYITAIKPADLLKGCFATNLTSINVFHLEHPEIDLAINSYPLVVNSQFKSIGVKFIYKNDLVIMIHQEY